MSDEIIGTAEPICGQCGAKLLIERGGAESESDARLICPTHGDQGSVHEFRDQIGEAVGKNVSDVLRDAFKDAGFEPH